MSDTSTSIISVYEALSKSEVFSNGSISLNYSNLSHLMAPETQHLPGCPQAQHITNVPKYIQKNIKSRRKSPARTRIETEHNNLNDKKPKQKVKDEQKHYSFHNCQFHVQPDEVLKVGKEIGGSRFTKSNGVGDGDNRFDPLIRIKDDEPLKMSVSELQVSTKSNLMSMSVPTNQPSISKSKLESETGKLSQAHQQLYDLHRDLKIKSQTLKERQILFDTKEAKFLATEQEFEKSKIHQSNFESKYEALTAKLASQDEILENNEQAYHLNIQRLAQANTKEKEV